jgi:hypothetical protein
VLGTTEQGPGWRIISVLILYVRYQGAGSSGLGLAWLGLAWLGLAWLGLAWLGLAGCTEHALTLSAGREH